MPYISQERREQLETYSYPANPGELNYALTKVLHNYLEHMGLSYSTINDCLGAIEGAKLEFYRRMAVPYEENKITENGDVVPRKRG